MGVGESIGNGFGVGEGVAVGKADVAEIMLGLNFALATVLGVAVGPNVPEAIAIALAILSGDTVGADDACVDDCELEVASFLSNWGETTEHATNKNSDPIGIAINLRAFPALCLW